MVSEVRNAYADALPKSPLAAPDAKTSRQGGSQRSIDRSITVHRQPWAARQETTQESEQNLRV